MIQVKTINLLIWTCPECGAYFGITDSYANELSKKGGSCYCINGHKLTYRESEADRLNAELANIKRDLGYVNEDARRARQDAEHFKNKANGYKGQLTLVKKRVANGICPCCNRYFVELHRHMQTKHKEFLEETGLMVIFDAGTPEAFDAALLKACEGTATSTAQQYRSIGHKIKALMFPVEPTSTTP